MNINLRLLSMQRSYYGRPKTITLAKTWPNETGYVTQRNTWHCEKLRDVARTNLTQRNTWMKRDTRKPATWRSENCTFRGENTLRYDSKWHCEQLRDVAKITWRCAFKRDAAQYLNKTWRDATKPTAWLSENVTLRGEKYVTLRQHYLVSKMSGNMDLSLWRHCLVSAIFFRIESEATNVTSAGIHDKMLLVGTFKFGMDKIHITFYNEWNYLSILGLKLIHVSERGSW